MRGHREESGGVEAAAGEGVPENAREGVPLLCWGRAGSPRPGEALQGPSRPLHGTHHFTFVGTFVVPFVLLDARASAPMSITGSFTLKMTRPSCKERP